MHWVILYTITSNNGQINTVQITFYGTEDQCRRETDRLMSNGDTNNNEYFRCAATYMRNDYS